MLKTKMGKDSKKGKANIVKVHRIVRRQGSHIFSRQSAHMAVRLSTLRISRPLTPRKIPGTHFEKKSDGKVKNTKRRRTRCSIKGNTERCGRGGNAVSHSGDTGFTPQLGGWRSCMVFVCSSRQILGYYVKYVTSASFNAIFNSSFTNVL
jgi:hypothetical protein